MCGSKKNTNLPHGRLFGGTGGLWSHSFYEANLEFSGGWGDPNKKNSHGRGMEIFFWTTQLLFCSDIKNPLTLLDRALRISEMAKFESHKLGLLRKLRPRKLRPKTPKTKTPPSFHWFITSPVGLSFRNYESLLRKLRPHLIFFIYQFFEGEREFIHHLNLLLFWLDLRLSGIFYSLSLRFEVFSRAMGDS